MLTLNIKFGDYQVVSLVVSVQVFVSRNKQGVFFVILIELFFNCVEILVDGEGVDVAGLVSGGRYEQEITHVVAEQRVADLFAGFRS